MNTERESIKKTVSIAYVLAIVGQGCNLLFYLFLYRILPVEQVGLFVWAMAIASFFGFFLDMGLYQILIRSFSRSQLDLNKAIASSILVRLPILLVAILLLNSWYAFSKPPTEQYWILVLVGIMQILLVIERMYQSWLKANQRQNTANLMASLEGIGWLLVAITGIYLMRITSLITIFSYLLLVHIFSLLLTSYITIRAHRSSGDERLNHEITIKETTKLLLMPGIVFTVLGFFTLLQNRLDWLLIASLTSKIELANYTLANKIYETFNMLFGVAIITAYPWICRSEQSSRSDKKLELYIDLIVSACVTIPLASVFVIPGLLEIVFNNKYEAAYGIVQILLISAAIAAVPGVLFYFLISKGLEKKILSVVILATLIQIAIDILLIPSHKGIGAAYGMLALVVTTLMGMCFLIYVEDPKRRGELLRFTIFLTIMLLLSVLFLIGHIPSFLSICGLLIAEAVMTYYVLFDIDGRSWINALICSIPRNLCGLLRKK